MGMADYHRALHVLTASAVREKHDSKFVSVTWVATNFQFAHNACDMFERIMRARFPNVRFAVQRYKQPPTADRVIAAHATVYHTSPTAGKQVCTTVVFRAYSRDPERNPKPDQSDRPIVFDPGLIVPNPKRS